MCTSVGCANDMSPIWNRKANVTERSESWISFPPPFWRKSRQVKLWPRHRLRVMGSVGCCTWEGKMGLKVRSLMGKVIMTGSGIAVMSCLLGYPLQGINSNQFVCIFRWDCLPTNTSNKWNKILVVEKEKLVQGVCCCCEGLNRCIVSVIFAKTYLKWIE